MGSWRVPVVGNDVSDVSRLTGIGRLAVARTVFRPLTERETGSNKQFRILPTTNMPVFSVYVPFLLASRGVMSKISTPCILPMISRRSRPVDCSMSVGMVPGWAPGGMRSCSEVISERKK